MPDSPAQEILSLQIKTTEPRTERMATAEELRALKEIAEAELATSEATKAAEKVLEEKHGLQTSPADEEVLEAISRIEEEVESPSSDWMLELAAILDQHRIWVESGGESGTKADLCGADLENADLTGVNLQGAFLQRANLRGADLSMANLRHASLVQADLCNANLLGAELRGANLMGATMYGVGRAVARPAGWRESVRCHAAGNDFGDRRIENSLGSDTQCALVLFSDADGVRAVRVVCSHHQ